MILQQPAPGDARGWLEREIDRLSSKIATSVIEDRLALYKYDAFVVDVARLVDLARSRPGYLLCQSADFTATGGFGRNCPVPAFTHAYPGIATIGTGQ